MAPVNASRVAVRRRMRRQVPQCGERDTTRENRDDYPYMGDDHNGEDHLGRQTNGVVGQDPDVQAENRDLDEEQGEDVDDVGGK